MEPDWHARHGGILGLVELISEHYEALSYDLMTRTRFTLDDLGGPLSWAALFSFVSNCGHDSAVFRAMNPDMAPWLDGRMVAPLLAQLIDAMNTNTYVNAVAHCDEGKRPDPPKRVKTPWTVEEAEGRHIGSDPIPISEFDAWWDAAGKENEKEVR